jgi:hypothetical protein
MTGLMANLDVSKVDSNDSFGESFFGDTGNKKVMDQFEEHEEIKVGGLKLEDLD